MTALPIPSLPDATLNPDLAQRAAADPTASVWVAASAGSGKTKVLADRVIRLLLDGVPPARLLCLTFTRAAAAEMSIRLTRQLARWATCDDDALRHDLDALQSPMPPTPAQIESARRLFARVLATPGGMRINTLHAFAQEVLRRFPLEAGVPPHFAALDETESAALTAEARADMLHQAAGDPTSKAGKALVCLAARLNAEAFSAALDALLAHRDKLAAALAQAGSAEALGAAVASAVDLPPGTTRAGLLGESFGALAFPPEGLLDAARLLIARGTKTYAPRGQAIARFLESAPSERLAAFDAYRRAFLTKEGEPFAAFANKDIATEHPEAVEALKREALRLASLDERLDTLQIVEESAALITLAADFERRYRAKKDALACLDFDDLIEKTVALLERPGVADWVLYKLDGGIAHLLLDEAQDTNPQQWRIVRALAEAFFAGEGAWENESRTLFVVGDEKQSIYSFQNADPALFAAMRRFFGARIDAAQKTYREVAMNISFRSAAAILRFVDTVFAPDAARVGVAAEPLRHFAFHADVAGEVELWPIVERSSEADDLNPSDVPEAYVDALSPSADLARRIARRIADDLRAGAPVYDRAVGGWRACRPGDFLILVPTRGRGGFVGHMVRALKRASVAVAGVDRMTLLDELAVRDLLALAHVALLPEDDLTLACALKGPLIGLDDDALMALALDRPDRLWPRVRAAGGVVGAYLENLLALADRETPLAFLTRLLELPCPADQRSGRRALARRLGDEAMDPIDELLEAAASYSTRRAPTLQGFLLWLAEAASDVKRQMEAEAAEVRLMTVHAAKGLEAPIVILPDTLAPPKSAKIPKVLWRTAGAFETPFYMTRTPRSALLRGARATALCRAEEEYRRLLYVALTRAGERLIVAGWKDNDAPADPGSWYALIARAFDDLPHAEEADGRRIFADAGRPLSAAAQAESEASCEPLPIWADQPVPPDPTPPRPLLPSRDEAEGSVALPSPHAAAFARGRIIHVLLQSLPDQPPAAREALAARYVANPQHALPPAAQKAIVAEVLGLLDDARFAPLFGPDSKAEVPLIGLAGARIVSGQVDRLCVRGDEVWVVDYKTNRPPPDDPAAVPPLYRRQMAAYRAVLAQIYPAKAIRTFLLWTHTARMMEITPDEGA
jgi:ATP-dependent helicase/nuclease subunit A